MKHKIFTLSLLVLVVGSLAGCGALLIGGAKGYESSMSSVKTDVDVSYDRAYDGSLETIRAMGGLSIDKKTEGWVKSDVNNYNVIVHIEKLGERATRISVTAKYYDLPKPQYARYVLVGILKRIKQQPFWMR